MNKGANERSMKDKTLFYSTALHRVNTESFSSAESALNLHIVLLTLLPMDRLSSSSRKWLAVFLLSLRP